MPTRREALWSIALTAVMPASALAEEADPAADEFSWLEDSNSPRMRHWVSAQNARTLGELQGDPRFERFSAIALQSEESVFAGTGEHLLARERGAAINHGWVYEVRKSGAHPQGVYRRTRLASYLAGKPEWQTLLDLDALSEKESRLWSIGDHPNFSPSGRRCLVPLSLNDANDAFAYRELDLERGAFVAGGFELPTGDHRVDWRDEDTLILSTDFGPGSLTTWGAPLFVKRWKRAQPLNAATEIFRAADHSSVHVFDGGQFYGHDSDENGVRTVHFISADEIGHATMWWRIGVDNRAGQIGVPASYRPCLYKKHYLIRLQEDWPVGGRIWKKDSVVAIPAADIGRSDPEVQHVFTPAEDMAVWDVFVARSGVLIFGSYLSHGRIWRAEVSNGSWQVNGLPLPEIGALVMPLCAAHEDTAFVYSESPVHAYSLYRIDVARSTANVLAKGTPQFDEDAFVAEACWAVSPDGTKVPYTLVRARKLAFNGTAPAIVYAYGMKGINLATGYSPTMGRLWLEQGGVYVFAHVRGGKERGERWWVKGLDRRHTYADAIAVTEDLIRRAVTAPKRVGYYGYSAGGLVGAVLINQRPELFGAAALKAPQLELVHKSVISWFDRWTGENGEWGDIRKPEIRAFLERTSPLQNLRPNPAMPKPLLLTASNDVNVFPAQVRRYAAKMQALNLPFLFYEFADGAHALATTPQRRAHLEALIYTYFSRQLIDPFKRTV